MKKRVVPGSPWRGCWWDVGCLSGSGAGSGASNLPRTKRSHYCLQVSNKLGTSSLMISIFKWVYRFIWFILTPKSNGLSHLSHEYCHWSAQPVAQRDLATGCRYDGTHGGWCPGRTTHRPAMPGAGQGWGFVSSRFCLKIGSQNPVVDIIIGYNFGDNLTSDNWL